MSAQSAESAKLDVPIDKLRGERVCIHNRAARKICGLNLRECAYGQPLAGIVDKVGAENFRPNIDAALEHAEAIVVEEKRRRMEAQQSK